MRTHCDAFKGQYSVWSGANKAVQEDTNSTFGNVVSDTGAKYSAIKAAWLETAPEIVDLKTWNFLQDYATACLSRSDSKQALDTAVATGKNFRKDAIAYCRAYRKAISDTQTQIAKLAREQAKETLTDQRDETKEPPKPQNPTSMRIHRVRNINPYYSRQIKYTLGFQLVFKTAHGKSL